MMGHHQWLAIITVSYVLAQKRSGLNLMMILFEKPLPLGQSKETLEGK